MRTNGFNKSDECRCGKFKAKHSIGKCPGRFDLRRSVAEANFDGKMDDAGDDNQTTSVSHGTRNNDGWSQGDDTIMGPQDGTRRNQRGSDSGSDGDTIDESTHSKDEGDNDDASGTEDDDSEECQDFCDDEKYW